jgi:diacylglycerol kinase
MISRYLKRVPHAVRGILYALRHDFGFRSQFYIAASISLVILYYFSPLSVHEFLFLGIAAMFILITELQNSAIEAALDKLHPERDEKIMRSKDMAAGAVLLAAGFAGMTLLLLVLNRFWF